MKGFVLAFCGVFILLSAAAQQGRQHTDVFPSFGDYMRRGWSFSGGLTYMAPNYSKDNQTTRLHPDTVYALSYDPKGKFGVTAGVGRFYAGESAVFNLVDVELGIKFLRGAEDAEARFLHADPTLDDSTPPAVSRSGFSSLYTYAALRLGNYFQINDNSFITNSLGINLDYRVMNKMNYNEYFPGIQAITPEPLMLQLHYRVGYGFKTAKRSIVYVSLETPVLNMQPFEEGRSTLAYFSSYYRPFMLRVSFWMFDKKAGILCPPKGGNGKRGKETLFGTKKGKPW